MVIGITLALFFAVTPAAQSTPPDVQRVIDLYNAILRELPEVVAGNQRAIDRTQALDQDLANAVKGAQPALVDALARDSLEAATAAAYALRHAPDPNAAVGPLLETLTRFDGRLANNIGLALEWLARNHASLQVPLPPLTRALSVRTWTTQQKIGQVVQALAERGAVTDADGALVAALIPMLASQRQQVFVPAREILPRLAGQTLGNDAEHWARWYEKAYNRRIDLAAGIYELVDAVSVDSRDGVETFTVEQDTYTSHDRLLDRLRQDAATARGLDREFSVAVRLPAAGAMPPGFDRLAEALMPIVPNGFVIQPASFDFMPFSQAVARLRRLIASR